MQKILKFVGMISALIISALGLSACSRDGDAVSLYGVVEPPYEEIDIKDEEIPLEDNINESFSSENISGDE